MGRGDGRRDVMTLDTWLGTRPGQARCGRFCCAAPRDAHCRAHAPAHCPGQCPGARPGADETLTQWLLAGQPFTGRTADMPATEFPTLAAFYDANPARATSPESDYGVHWHEGDATFPVWRVSYIKDTGEIYAIRLQGRDDRVTLLGRCNPDPADVYYRTLDKILDGWAELDAERRRLSWVAGRLSGAPNALILAEPATLVRAVTAGECGWLPRDFTEAELLWTYRAPLYGAVNTATGIALTSQRGQPPFYEFPRDAVHVCASCAASGLPRRIPGQALAGLPGHPDPDGPDRNGASDGSQVISDADPGL
jgi:hypothetical protein